jgi:hypothetical protein
MGPFKVISTFSICLNGPIQGHQQSLSLAPVGPFNGIGNFSDLHQQAHSGPSATFLKGNHGPIQGHRQSLSLALVGPFKIISNLYH